MAIGPLLHRLRRTATKVARPISGNGSVSWPAPVFSRGALESPSTRRTKNVRQGGRCSPYHRLNVLPGIERTTVSCAITRVGGAGPRPGVPTALPLEFQAGGFASSRVLRMVAANFALEARGVTKG